MDGEGPRAFRRAVMLVGGVWLMLAAAIWLVWAHVLRLDTALGEQRFSRDVDELQRRLTDRMTAYEVVLRGGGGLFHGDRPVTRALWRHYVTGLALEQHYPGLQGLGFAELVPSTQAAAFVRQVQSEGFPSFHISPPGERERYVVVKYLEPSNWRNQRAFGYDGYADQARRAAMDQARDGGTVALSAPVVLVQETEQEVQTGALLFWPLYRTGADVSTVAGRRAALVGFVYSPFRMADLVQATVGAGIQQLQVSLQDDAGDGHGRPLFHSRVTSRGQPLYRVQRRLALGGRVWRLTVATTPSYEAALPGAGGAWLWSSLAMAGLLALVTGAYVYHRERERWRAAVVAAQLRQREERFRQVIEGAPNAMLMVDSEGRLELLNAQAERLFGYRREELIGQPVELLLPERFRLSHQGFRRQFQAAPEARQMGTGRELFARRKDGTEVPVEIGLNPIMTDTGLKTLGSVIDLSERRRAEERFRLLVEAAPFAIVLVNREARIELVNTQTERLFGYTRTELVGQPIELLVPAAVQARHVELRDNYLQAPSQRRMGGNRELFGRHKSGREIPVEVGLAPIHTGDDILIKAVVVDITERKASEQKLKQQAEQLALASRYKSEFLANMSHELRTPLNSIMILSEQLKDNAQGNLSAKQVMHAEIIHRSGADLLRLINDILDLSKIEAGRMTLVLEPVLLRRLVTELETNVRPQIEAKHLEFQLQVAEAVPAELQTDAQRLYQVLTNLLSNAIKFTDSGVIRLEVALARGELPEGMGAEAAVTFTVRDSGIGIPHDQQEQIFQAFQQVDGSTSRRYGGSGLGLAISREFARLLGGTIRVESVLGVGSVFTLYLPLTAAEAPVADVIELPPAPAASVPLTAAMATTATTATGRQELRVLVVEDDPGFAAVVAEAAGRHGFACRLCQRGEEALAILAQEPVDAVLLDLLLPDISGWEVLRAIQASPATRSLPVHILSCVNQPPDWRDESMSYLVKPVGARELQRLFERLQRQLQPAVVAAPVPAETAEPGEAGGNALAGRQVLLVDDDVRNIYAMCALLGGFQLEVAVARHGEEALQLLAQHPVDLVFMDIAMPVMDGYTAIRILKEERHFQRPIIALTAHAMKGDREKCLAAGADDYLAKPVSSQTLKAMLDKWLVSTEVDHDAVS